MRVSVRQVVEITPLDGDPLDLLRTTLLDRTDYAESAVVTTPSNGCVTMTFEWTTEV